MPALRLLAFVLSVPLAFWTAASTATSTTTGPATEPHTSAAPADFAAPVATIDGAPVTRGELAEYLIALAGRGPLEDLVTLRLLEAAARALDPTGARIEAALDAAWADDREQMLKRTAGDTAALEADLLEIGFTLEQYEARFRTYKRAEVLEELLVLANRTVDQAARSVQRRHTESGARQHTRQCESGVAGADDQDVGECVAHERRP